MATGPTTAETFVPAESVYARRKRKRRENYARGEAITDSRNRSSEAFLAVAPEPAPPKSFEGMSASATVHKHLLV